VNRVPGRTFKRLRLEAVSRRSEKIHFGGSVKLLRVDTRNQWVGRLEEKEGAVFCCVGEMFLSEIESGYSFLAKFKAGGTLGLGNPHRSVNSLSRRPGEKQSPLKNFGG